MPIVNTVDDLSSYLKSSVASSTYQPILVSGTNIKTINSTSLLGSGDVTVQAPFTMVDTTLMEVN